MGWPQKGVKGLAVERGLCVVKMPCSQDAV
jgi:hypothetical protein